MLSTQRQDRGCIRRNGENIVLAHTEDSSAVSRYSPCIRFANLTAIKEITTSNPHSVQSQLGIRYG